MGPVISVSGAYVCFSMCRVLVIYIGRIVLPWGKRKIFSVGIRTAEVSVDGLVISGPGVCMYMCTCVECL